MSPTNSSLDLFNQNVTFTGPEGTNQTLSFNEIDAANQYSLRCLIVLGPQIGACFMMFWVVLILTKQEKRRSLMYLLNLLSLFFGFLRALLLSIYFISPWDDFYAYFASDYDRVTRSAYATSIVATIIPLLMTITVNLSLVIQARVVCKGMDNIYRHIVLCSTCLVMAVAVGFRVAEMIFNSRAIIGAAYNLGGFQWVAKGALISETISIWFFTVIFTAKLAWTLWNRHRNGWKQWSGVRILALMGTCTMVVPSIFAVLEYVTIQKFPESGTLAMTTVALLLPISSLWASASIDQEASTFKLSQLASSTNPSRRGSEQHEAQRSGSIISLSTTPSARVDYNYARMGSAAPIRPFTIDSRVEHIESPRNGGRDSTELDLEALGVRVDKSYSVHSARC